MVVDKPVKYAAEEKPLQLGHYGPIPIFTNDDEELKWLYFQEEETKAMLKMKKRRFRLTYPDENTIWPRWPESIAKIDLSHKLPQHVKDAQWKTARNAQISLQKAINGKVAKEKAKFREKEVEKEKRQADDLLQSVRKRMKFSNKRRKEKASRVAKRHQTAEEAKAMKVLNRKIEERYLNDTATTASMFRDSGLTAQEQVDSFHKWKKEEDHRLEKQRQRINKGRRKQGLPEIPQPEEPDPRVVEAAMAREKEDARAKDKQNNVVRHVPDSATQQARESADRNRLADAARQAQRLVDRLAREEEERERRADAARRAQDLADQRVRGEAERKQRAEAEKLKRDKSEKKRIADVKQAKEEAERKRKAEAEQLEKEEAQRKREVAARRVQELADQQAQSEETERKRRVDAAQANLTATTTAKPLSTSFVTTKPQVTIKPRPGQVKPAVTSLTATSPRKYPSTLDQTLLHALQEGDSWDADVQKAIANSLKTFAGEAKESLAIRAASQNITEDQYAQSQGFKSAAAYLNAHVKDASGDTQPTPVGPQRPQTEEAKRNSHLEEYKKDMLKAIKEGITNRGNILGFSLADDFAKNRGYASLDA